MAVIQISKIQVRRGLQENLPQLSSGEFGWSVDTRKLYIGNGSLSEGAPEVGLTEILTEHSSASQQASIDDLTADLANLTTYTYNLSGNVTALEGAATPTYITLADNVSSFANVGTVPLLSGSGTLNYSITRNNEIRTGTLRTSIVNGQTTYDDDYTETSNVGVMWNFLDDGASARWQYVTSSTGNTANLALYPLRPFSS